MYFFSGRKSLKTSGSSTGTLLHGEDGDMWIRISEQYKGLFADHFGAVYRTNHGVGDNSRQIPLPESEMHALQIYISALERCQSRGLRDEYREFSLMVYIARIQFRSDIPVILFCPTD